MKIIKTCIFAIGFITGSANAADFSFTGEFKYFHRGHCEEMDDSDILQRGLKSVFLNGIRQELPAIPDSKNK